MKTATLTLVVLLASCGLRPKQAAGSLSWVAIAPATTIDSQPIRVGVVTALLVVGAVFFEWDARDGHKKPHEAQRAAAEDAIEQTEFTCDLGCADPSIGPDRDRYRTKP